MGSQRVGHNWATFTFTLEQGSLGSCAKLVGCCFHDLKHNWHESGPEAPGFPEERKTEGQQCQVWEQLHPQLFTDSDSSYLIMQFLQKGNLFLQGFHFTLQVKTCQRGIVNILFWKEKKKKKNGHEGRCYEVCGLSYLFILNEPDKLSLFTMRRALTNFITFK